jgi:2-succinyl-6-hydroxy-2,4-cyclohexadiene-1-carboxylate synthase
VVTLIHVFHGFLGSPEDLSYLSSGELITFYDLYVTDPQTITLHENDTVIGYSLGGRVALELAHRYKFQMKNLVILSAHPGLREEERPERSLWEESILKRLVEMSPDEFLTYWNALPLFKSDLPLRDLPLKKLRESALLFEKFRLSRQRCFLPELAQNRDKILWISGIQDDKYSKIARDLILPLDISCVFIEGGHRLYQKKSELLTLLKSRNIL